MAMVVIVIIVLYFCIRDSITKYVYVTKPRNESKKPLRTRSQFIEESLHPQDKEPDIKADTPEYPQIQSAETCDNMSEFQGELQSVLQTKEQIQLQKRLQEDLELKQEIEFEYSMIKKKLKEKAISGDYSVNSNGQKVVRVLSTSLTHGLKTVSNYSPSFELMKSGASSSAVMKASYDPLTVVVATTPSQQSKLDTMKSLMESKISADNISICQVVVYYNRSSYDLKDIKQYPFPAIVDNWKYQTRKEYWDTAFEYSCVVP